MEFMILEGYAFEKNFFQDFSLKLIDNGSDDTEEIYNYNGYKPFYKTIGDLDYFGIEIYKRFKEIEENFSPFLYIIQIWENGSHNHSGGKTFFVHSLIDFNYLLKEIKPMIDVALYFEQKEIWQEY